MSVWKKLNKQDAFVTTYVAKKTWNLQGNQLEGLGVKFLPAYSTFNVAEDTKEPATCTIVSGSFKGEQESVSYCSDLLLRGNNTCYFDIQIESTGVEANGRKEIKVSKLNKFGEDVIRTNKIKIYVPESETPASPSTISVHQILNGQAKILIDSNTVNIRLKYVSGLCAGNEYTFNII